MVSRVERGPVADWFWTIDRLFLITFVLLMGIGLMLSFAASPAVAERLNLDSFHFVKRHAFFMMPALGVMIGLSFLSPRQVRRMAMLILAASLIMMVLVLFIGLEVKGGRRWLSVGSMSIQPSRTRSARDSARSPRSAPARPGGMSVCWALSIPHR